MQVTVVNKTDNKEINNYKKFFAEISERLVAVLSLDEALLCTVVFCDDKMIKELNREYRNIDEATDVLSFALKDQEEDYQSDREINDYLGDIFISVDTMIQQAKEYNHSTKREACFLFTHGLLHLFGYDHQDDEQQKVMFSLQRELLNEIA